MRYSTLARPFGLLFLLAGLLNTGFLIRPAAAPAPIRPAAGEPVLLPQGTVITFEVYETADSKTVQKGSLVGLSVYKPVVINGKTLINAGRYGEGKISRVRRAGVFGRPGVVTLEAISVETVDNQTVAVFGQPLSKQGQDRRLLAWGLSIGLTLAGMVILAATHAAAVGFAVFLVAAGLLINGRNTEIAAGEKIRGVVQTDVWVNP